MRSFDFVLTLWKDNPPEVRVDFRTGDPRDLDGSSRVASLIVRYGWSSGRSDAVLRPRAVTLEADDGLTPTELARFAWSRWMGAADAYAANRVEGAAELAAATRAEGPKSLPKPKGRPPLGPAHDREVLDRWRALKAQGNPRVMADLVEQFSAELGYPVPYRTVASWVRRAQLREAKLVAPAAPKRAKKVSKRASGPVEWDGVTAPWEKE